MVKKVTFLRSLLQKTALAAVFFACSGGIHAALGAVPIPAAAFTETLKEEGTKPQFVTGEGKAESPSIQSLKLLTERQLSAILHDLAAVPAHRDREAQKLAVLYRVFRGEEAREKAGMRPLAPFFAAIDALPDQQALALFLARAEAEGRTQPFLRWAVNPDFSASSRFALYVLPPRLNLTLTPHTANYLNFVTAVLRHLKVENAEGFAAKIIELERKMAAGIRGAVNTERPSDSFMSYRADLWQQQLRGQLPATLLAPLLNNHPNTPLLVRKSAYFTVLDQLFRDTDLATLKAYLKYYYFCHYADFLDFASYRVQANFSEIEMKGRKTLPGLEERAIDFASRYLGDALGRLYVARYFSAGTKKEAETLAAQMADAAREKIAASDNGSEEGKRHALEKLAALNIEVAYPERLRSSSDLRLPNESLGLFPLVVNLDQWQKEEQLKLLSAPVDRKSWNIHPYTIDAYYDVLRNEVVFPAAILGPPFYSPREKRAEALAKLGALMAHEITHAFDFVGRNYDAKGTYNPGLEALDEARYEDLKTRLVRQYNRYRGKGEDAGVNLGEKTLNENMADIGGLSLALSILENELPGKRAAKKEEAAQKAPELKQFFSAWMGLFGNTPESAPWRAPHGTFNHMPDTVRAYAPLLNFAEFYDVFAIPPTHPLYLKEEDRVNMW